MPLWRMLQNSTLKTKWCIHTVCLAVARRNLPSVALNPWSYFHWGWLLWIHVVSRASLNSLLYHGALADWVNRRKASTWKKSQWLSASWKLCQHYSNPTHFYGETVLSGITQNLECLSLHALFKWLIYTRQGTTAIQVWALQSRALKSGNLPIYFLNQVRHTLHKQARSVS